MYFSIVAPADAVRAHEWHSGFAAAKQSLLPRNEGQFTQFINEGYVWGGRDEHGFAGLVYCYPSEKEDGHIEWELGGLMVATREKNKGVASTLSRLVLMNTLVKEDPFRRGDKVIAHVHVSNDEPRDLIQKALLFEHVKREAYPAHLVPGLPTNSEGMVEGDVFGLTKESLVALANWCDLAPTKLKDGRPLDIRFAPGFDFSACSAALRSMAR